MSIHLTGLIIGAFSFLVIGLFHPIVVKTEYHFGTRPWWLFLLVGLASCAAALFVGSVIVSAMLAVLGFSCFWSIKELFDQRRRVLKGWFPVNPKRKAEYEEKE